MNPIAEEILMHYGMSRRSGRYPWGSGENPYQHSGDFLSRVDELKSQGMSDTEIAKAMGLTTTQYRTQKSLAKDERRALDVARAKSLREDGLSLNEIAKEMGFANDSSVRSLLNENSEVRMNQATKNLTMGEGGALLLREAADLPLAEQLRDKGTDQAAFRRGEKTFYQWQRQGISAVPSGLAAACLLPQLEQLAAITAARRALWQRYDAALAPLYAAGLLGGPYVPPDAFHNAHIYFIKTADAAERSKLAAYLAARGIGSASHFQPLHSAPAGRRYGRFHGEDRYTTRESERLLRLPLYHGMPPQAVEQTAAAISAFYGRKGV